MAEPEADAIRQDVPDADPVADPPDAPTAPESNDPDNNPEEEAVKSPRQEAMDRIVGLREQEQSTEVEESAGQVVDNRENREKLQQTLKVKVDGVEKEIPIDEAKAVVQKNMAADKRLNDATLKQQELQQWEQQLVQREQQLQAKPERQPPEHEKPDDLKEQVQTAVDRLYDGDTDEAVEALTGLIEKRSNQATEINPDAIVAKAKEEVLQVQRKHEFEQEVKAAKKQFNDTFKELAEVPELFDQADQRTVTLMNEHPDWTPTQVIMEAGRQTQDFVNKIRGNGGNNGDASRLERKASLKSVPRSNGSINYQTKPSEQEKVTPKQVINQMREARGQA